MRAKTKLTWRDHVENAAEQLIAPDRNELASYRELGARCSYFPAGEFERYAAPLKQKQWC
jgi:hypothetical protein